jgi:hypothetical protein
MSEEARAKGRALLDFLNVEAYREGDESTWELPLSHPLTAAVAPLFVASKGRLHPVGSAFMVSSLRIALTANHNLSHVLGFHHSPSRARRLADDPERKHYRLDDLNLYLLLSGLSEAGEPASRLWSLKTTHTPRPADLAYAVLDRKGDDGFRFMPLGLSPAVPRKGSRLSSIGYCDFSYPEGGIPLDAVHSGSFEFSKDYSHRLIVCQGEVDLIFSRKVASGFLEGPCVRTNYDIPHGLSGGPALDERGYVAGVNSAGGRELFGHSSSLVSLIYPSMQTRVDLAAVNALDRSRIASVRPRVLDLVLMGKIKTDESEQLLGFSDTDSDEGPEAVHPMVHLDDYQFVYESISDYTENNPALSAPNRQRLRRIIYQYESGTQAQDQHDSEES